MIKKMALDTSKMLECVRYSLLTLFEQSSAATLLLDPFFTQTFLPLLLKEDLVLGNNYVHLECLPRNSAIKQLTFLK